MFMYGAVSPLEGAKAIEDLERQVEEWGVKAVKLYPVDYIDGELRPWYMSDEEVLYPILERCRTLGDLLDERPVHMTQTEPIGLAGPGSSPNYIDRDQRSSGRARQVGPDEEQGVGMFAVQGLDAGEIRVSIQAQAAGEVLTFRRGRRTYLRPADGHQKPRYRPD